MIAALDEKLLLDRYRRMRAQGYLFALGPWEIAAIVLAVVLLFGVGKLSQVGGALGKTIREFKKEKNSSIDTPPRLEDKNKDRQS